VFDLSTGDVTGAVELPDETAPPPDVVVPDGAGEDFTVEVLTVLDVEVLTVLDVDIAAATLDDIHNKNKITAAITSCWLAITYRQ
jgi:hypothetical protein